MGPRPELESIVANYEPWQHARHAVKPGLTGLWQVKARGDGEMHEHTDLDIEYAQNVTLRGDLKIMAPHVACHSHSQGLLTACFSQPTRMAMASQTRTLVTGAGGFIGNHLVNYLKDQGHWVRGVDIKRPEYSDTRRTSSSISTCALRRLPRRVEGRRPRLRARGRHGRHGIHLREPRDDPAQQLADRHAHARGGARRRRAALPLHVVGLRLPGAPADRGRRRRR